jgi:poly-gamma-glutamate synthesis protein (capsule biosynthesis protein)
LIAGDLCVPAHETSISPDQPVPWEQLAGELRAHDLAFVNLECPLTTDPRAIGKSGPALHGDPALATLVAAGGFDGVTLANNHTLDSGDDGLRNTLEACGAAGLLTVGAGMNRSAAEQPLAVERGGLRIALLACCEREFSVAGPDSPGAAALDPWRTPQAVREVASQADVVIVVLHAGNEHVETPRPGLVAACRALASSGARAVVCHHAHAPGPVEVFHGVPIFYGLGNFLFPGYPEAGEAWYRGYAVSLDVQADAVASFRLLPYEQCRTGLEVRPLDAVEEKEFAARLQYGASMVADAQLLEAAWVAHCRRERRHYLHMALGLTRFERALLRTGVWPRWRRSRSRLPELLNLFTCDSHREAVETILRREDSS